MDSLFFHFIVTILLVLIITLGWRSPAGEAVSKLEDQLAQLARQEASILASLHSCNESLVQQLSLPELPCNRISLQSLDYTSWYKASIAQLGGFEPYCALVNLETVPQKITYGGDIGLAGIDWANDAQLSFLESVAGALQTAKVTSTFPGALSLSPSVPGDAPGLTELLGLLPSTVARTGATEERPTLPLCPLDAALLHAVLAQCFPDSGSADRPKVIVDIGGLLPLEVLRVFATLSNSPIVVTIVDSVSPARNAAMATLYAAQSASRTRSDVRSHVIDKKALTKELLRSAGVTYRHDEKYSLFEVLRVKWPTILGQAGPVVLRAGDLVLARTSHVARIDSDALYLHTQILTTLPPGVRVVLSGIFLPYHYPRLLYEKYHWFATEQYFTAAVLAGSARRLGILFASAYASRLPSSDALRKAIDNSFGGAGKSLLRACGELAAADGVSSPSLLVLEVGPAPNRRHAGLHAPLLLRDL